MDRKKAPMEMTDGELLDLFAELCAGAGEKGESRVDISARSYVRSVILGRLSDLRTTCFQAADTVQFEFPITAKMLRELGTKA